MNPFTDGCRVTADCRLEPQRYEHIEAARLATDEPLPGDGSSVADRGAGRLSDRVPSGRTSTRCDHANAQL